MKRLSLPTKRGSLLTGVLFDAPRNVQPSTVVIAITGIHGNFYSNPFYVNLGKTLSDAGIDFIYAQTADAFGEMPTLNVKTGKQELIGSWNEDFNNTDEDIEAYLNYVYRQGYTNIILAGHSLGANKVIYYLSRHRDTRIKHFIFLSPANLEHLTSVVTEEEKQAILNQRQQGAGEKRMPFNLLGWIPGTADTDYQWVFDNILNNVHVEPEKDFSQVAAITQTGALIIGSYDRFTYGEPQKFLENINDHMQTAKQNRLIVIPKTGHTYQQKEQVLADEILKLVQSWQ
ncbi:alpha/beta fold hydrolase [uncultured Limosilactobacillus sp.]|uniref:alpha/beta fold hydrolase n=1 Tax=uncultured Limosilactobacillus sp. TaxID=2837629 RepID=UPI0025CF76E1|nr:alpha/beta fold hydrolase [uncultured Limosilactobacillus sp.]